MKMGASRIAVCVIGRCVCGGGGCGGTRATVWWWGGGDRIRA